MDEVEQRLSQYGAEVRQELTDNILPFWMHFAVDWEHGGFLTHKGNDRAVLEKAPKALVQHARMLWTFAHSSLVLGRVRDYPASDTDQYSAVARHARRALLDLFWDPDHGGFFWMLDYRGRPLERQKLLYGQAFAVYGLVEHYLASSETESLERAIQVYRLIESGLRDAEHRGYWEGGEQDWTLAPALHVDDTPLPVVKGMNSHLHLLEAYTSLLRAWDNPDLRADLHALLDIILNHMLRPTTRQFHLYFDRAWQPLSDEVSFGHDIEGSWLLLEAAEVLGDRTLLARTGEAALQMASSTLKLGVNGDGGVCASGLSSGVTDRSKVWWTQAEAMVGFLAAYELSGDPRFLDASLAVWCFVQEHIVDRQFGDWFWAVDESGRPSDRGKAGPWKAAYHNGRACMEIMQRVERLMDSRDLVSQAERSSTAGEEPTCLE
jgi:mannobiose 2-epimerase